MDIKLTDKYIFLGKYLLSNNNFVNFVGAVRNQYMNNKCNYSWAFALTSAMSDGLNFKINKFPFINLSPKLLLCNEHFYGCNNPNSTFDYVSKIYDNLLSNTHINSSNHGIMDETCALYDGFDFSNKKSCLEIRKCNVTPQMSYLRKWNIELKDDNHGVFWFKRYFLKKILSLKNENILNYFLKNKENYSPLVCQIKHNEVFYKFNKNEIINSDWYSGNLISYVNIIGVINKDDKEVFVIKNFNGEQWGHHGYFFIKTSDNYLNIKNDCVSLEVEKETREDGAPVELKGEIINSWHDKDNINYLTPVLNQSDCGSCWAFASISVLQDRLNIKRIKNNSSFPMKLFSMQHLIDNFIGGSCSGGGTHSILYNRIKKNKEYIVSESCNNYTAKEFVSKENEGEMCKYFNGKRLEYVDFRKNNNKLRFQIKDFKYIKTIDEIKKEVTENGPVVCAVEISDEFLEKFKIKHNAESIISQKISRISTNHEVAIIGYGEEKGQKFWIIRNSWSVGWGVNGWFKLKMGDDDLGITGYCSYPEIEYDFY